MPTKFLFMGDSRKRKMRAHAPAIRFHPGMFYKVLIIRMDDFLLGYLSIDMASAGAWLP